MFISVPREHIYLKSQKIGTRKRVKRFEKTFLSLSKNIFIISNAHSILKIRPMLKRSRYFDVSVASPSTTERQVRVRYPALFTNCKFSASFR